MLKMVLHLLKEIQWKVLKKIKVVRMMVKLVYGQIMVEQEVCHWLEVQEVVD
jgi:hypothetical protein